MIELIKKKSNVNFVTPFGAGEDGGYYIPSIDENGILTWVASKPDMPEVEPIEAKGINIGAKSYGVGSEIFNDYENNQATGDYSHAEGFDCKTNQNYAHAEGYKTFANGVSAHSEGDETQALADCTHTEGHGTKALEYCAHAEGCETEANHCSHSEGYKTKATGSMAHAEGKETRATGMGAHAEGDSTYSKGYYTHAEGSETIASGDCAHTEGKRTKATGAHAHAEGNNTEAIGIDSHAEGSYTKTKGEGSHAEGIGTVANVAGAHAQGRYNIEDTEGIYAHIVGNGSKQEGKKAVCSNAHTVDWNGNGWFAGEVTVGKDKEKLARLSDLYSVSDRFYDFYYEELWDYILVLDESSKYYDLLAPEAIVELEKDKMDNIEITPEDEGKFLMIQGGAVAKVAIPNITEEVF